MPRSRLSSTPARSTPSTPGDAAEALDFDRFMAGQDPVDAAAADWMVRRQDGLTPEEEAQLRAWLDADASHARALQGLEAAWGRLDELPEDGVDALRARLPAVEPAGAAATTGAPHAWWAPWRPLLPRLARPMAAIALVFLVVGGVAWVGGANWQNQPTFHQSFATERGQQQEVRLPDGSVLRLDTATQVDVRLYRQRREVRLLEGQAMLAVASRPQQPFDVLAGPLRITVVGTRFSVRHTQTGLGNGGVRVSVEEGRVRVARNDGEDAAGAALPASVELGAGQSVAADAQGGIGAVAGHAGGAGAPWLEGRVDFDNASLAQALAEFERYHRTGLVLHDREVAEMRIHGSFDLHRIDAFARALPQVLPVRLVPAGDGRTEIVRARPR